MSALPDAVAAPERRLAFLHELAAMSGLPAEAAREWSLGGAVALPEGLPCRIRWADELGDAPHARVEVLLPLPARALTGDETARLMQWQSALFIESGWWLGLSPEGLLQLGSLVSHHRAELTRNEIDVGHALAPTVLKALLGSGAQP
ncbi:MAG: hypothetical protein ABW220_08465 [Burkholderiaceae bacterium]